MEFSWKEIILTVFGGGGVVVGVIAILNVFFTRYDLAKKQKKDDTATHDSQTAEHRRIDLDEDARNVAERERILEFWKKRVEYLEKEIETLKSHDSLSRPTTTKIYAATRRVRRFLDALKLAHDKANCAETFADTVAKLETAIDDLEASLP